MSTNNQRRRGNSTNINHHNNNHSTTKPQPGRAGKTNVNKATTKPLKSIPATSKNGLAPKGTQSATTEVKGSKGSRGTLGLFWVVLRLLTLLGKGLVAVVIFGLIFNLALVVIDKTLFDGKLAQYIHTPTWKDIFDGQTGYHRH